MSEAGFSQAPDPSTARRWFFFGCLFESAFGVAALGLAPLLHISLMEQIRWKLSDAAWGAVATGPLLSFFAWMLRTRFRTLAEIRVFLEHHARPILGTWSVLDLALISSLAGIGEELLFRGVIQTGLRSSWGSGLALLGTSVLFGLGHAVTRGYAVVALVMSVYLGLLTYRFGNLLVPIVTHSLYDWMALVYFLRVHRSR